MSEITDDDRKEAMAAAIRKKPHEWQAAYMRALERVKTPGELGELADVGAASIEADRPHEVDVYVAVYEEADTLDPGRARDLAFELLVLADLAERPEADHAT